MIRNSYQILDCNKDISNFKLLEKSNLKSDKLKQIKDELNNYHTNNKFDVKEKNNIINNQDIINSKFIFKKGYYFCSYIYRDNEENITNYYISEPTYEFKNNPLCPKDEFTNIVISNTIPLNMNIIGVIYYYKYLSDSNESQCKSNIFTYIENTVTHLNQEKYIIDIVYFNALLDNIKYELNYIYYKNINYTTLENISYRNTLEYNYLNHKIDENYNRLSTRIENQIYKETNDLILDLNKGKKKLTILLNLINTTKKDPDNSLKNILLKIVNNTRINKGCGANIFSNYIIETDVILLLMDKITTNTTILYTHIKKIEADYSKLLDSLYTLSSFEDIIKNENEYNNVKKVFDAIILARGDETIEDINTLFGLKPIVENLVRTINTDISELNANITMLRNNIGDNILNNNTLIDNLFNTIKTYISYEIHLNLINDGITDDKMEIFMKYNSTNNNVRVINNKILKKYKLITDFNSDYNINSLKYIKNMITKLNIFKLNTTNIVNIYNDINDFYNYLDGVNDTDKRTYATLYDIFYKTKNINYQEYINNTNTYKDLKDKFGKITSEGQVEVLPKYYESIFKKLPKNDSVFLKLYKNMKKNNDTIRTDNSVIQMNDLNIDTYRETFVTEINLLKNKYNNIKIDLQFNQESITNICNTHNIINQYNKHINKLINVTKINVNVLTVKRDAKKFENLAVDEQNYIRTFLKINNNIFSIFNKYINQDSYFITNNFYNISVRNFNNFINLVNIPSVTDEMEVLNIYYSLKNCFILKETNKTVNDEFIVIAYCFCISMLSEYPIDFLRFLFSINKNDTFNNLFNKILQNKIYLYTENNTNYIKIISSISDITLSEYILNNNINNVNNKINEIKNELINELNKGNLPNILKKISVIKYFITTDKKDINIIKTYNMRNKYNIIDDIFKNYNTFKLFNFNNDINKLIKETNNYKIITQDNNTNTDSKYCVSLGKNNVYECDVCDFSKTALVKNINSCPTNLPYNLDYDLNNHLDTTEGLAFEADNFRIFSYISEPKKQLIYKRGKIIYGIPKEDSTFNSFVWKINKEYKHFTLLSKIDNNEDEAIIIRINNPSPSPANKTLTRNLNILYNNKNEFYLNNFYINNIISQDNLNNDEYKYPNSHQLYIKKESNYNYIYFIENNIKYYMYLDFKKNKVNYDIVWREETYSSKIPYIKNYAKWRLIRTSEYIENIFDNPRILYNIRSALYFDINKRNEIKGLLANNNSCLKYDILLNNYLNQNYDIINNTKFKFTGYNNNYNIAPYIKNNKSIFNDPDLLLQFINYTNQQEKINNKDIENKPDELQYRNYKYLIDKYKSIGNPENKITLYLIKNPNNETYLYLDLTRNVVEFIPLFKDNSKKESEKISKNDNISNGFLWITQNSINNDKTINDKIEVIEEEYNTMITSSLDNLEKNINSKNNNIQSGGSIIEMSSKNTTRINNLIKKLKFIKYNDYKLLLKQLELIKANSKIIVDSDISYNNNNNKALLKFKDYVTKSNQEIFIYFNKKETKYTCNLTDISNIQELIFNLKKNDIASTLNTSDIEIIIDNNNYPVENSVTIVPKNTYDKVTINVSSIGENISQLFIYINIYEITINIKKSDVVVYYNKNPLYNKLDKYVIKNTYVNSKFNLFNNLNIGKSNKNVYDFSIKLNKNDSENPKIYNIEHSSIIEHLKTYNNDIGTFYIKKNKLKDNVQYNSKLFYISNDRNILYINLFTNNNTIDPIYNIPCRTMKNMSNDKLIPYICISINNHVKLLKNKNKLDIINNIFEYIIILYKNNTYANLNKVLITDNTTISTTIPGIKYDNINDQINLYIDVTKLKNQYNISTNLETMNTEKIPNKVTIVFDKIINESKYIYFNMIYDDFIHLRKLYDILINIQFTNLYSLIDKNKNKDKTNEIIKDNNLIYVKYINKIKDYLNYISDIKNNTNNANFDNITSILDSNNVYNYLELINYYLGTSDTTSYINNTELKLYLYNLFNSNINVNNYLIDLVLTISSKIQQVYDTYVNKINVLLKNDNRFIECTYVGTSIIDIIYKYIKFYDDYANNEDDISYKTVKHGFYYKNNEDIYVNYVKIDQNINSITNNVYLITFEDVIKNYSKMFPQLLKNKIMDKTLNKPYKELYNNYKKEIMYILDDLLNFKFNNIKISRTIKINKINSEIQNKFIKNEMKSNTILNYNNIKFNSNISDKNIVKGDVILYKFKRNSIKNNLYNSINLLLPLFDIDISINNWQSFNELKEITFFSNNINNIINKQLNIYSIANYNKLFTSDLIDDYIVEENLLLKEIIPFKNKVDSRRNKNICYLKLGENNTLELHLNQYKYKIKLKQFINSNLYTICKNVNNNDYYLEFVSNEDKYEYTWVKEHYNMLDNLTNKLLFINITPITITENNVSRTEINENNMVMLEYENRFSNIFSHLHKFINNGESNCELYNTYYTIHSKKYNKLINNNSITNILDLALNNSKSGYVLKDPLSIKHNLDEVDLNNSSVEKQQNLIKELVQNSKFYVSSSDCNSYIIYNSYKNIILENNFSFIELDKLNLSLSDILTDINNNKDYHINLKYDKDKNMFYELNENCAITKNSNKLIIKNKSMNEKIAKHNTYYIYYIENTETNLFEIYKKQIGLNEIILEEDLSFYIIPVNNIQEKTIQIKKKDKYINTDLVLQTIDQHDNKYLIRNTKNEYLKVASLIDYKKPLRATVEFVQTNKINIDYVWFIKTNVEKIENINIKNDSSICMVGGQNLILNKSIKQKYLENINKDYSNSSEANYNDLCNNNTHVNFINYNVETQDDVSYVECRESCATNNDCVGFSYSNNKCNMYDNITKETTNIIYYDCNNILTTDKNIGEIKKNIIDNNNKNPIAVHKIDLIDNNLYYIKSHNGKYIQYDRANYVFKNNNYLKLTNLNSVENIFSNNLFKFKILKNNFNSGNSEFISILRENKHIEGSYTDKTTDQTIKITYNNENNRYVWNHYKDQEKWFLENTNNIYEYVVNEGIKKNTIEDTYYCPYYKDGYKTLKVNKNENNQVISVEGPGNAIYEKIYIEDDVSIFKHIENIETLLGNNSIYNGNVFIIKNTSDTSKSFYNIFTIVNKTKYYIYEENNKILLKKGPNISDINSKSYLWEFEKYNNNLSLGYSYQKIIVGGDETNKENNELIGGIKKNNLINGNSYYIKTVGDKYLCANKHYTMLDGSKPKVIAIHINSPLATEPNKIRKFNNKFVRASIDLSNTKYNIAKAHSINDDILWKLNKTVKDGVSTYTFYNIKHSIYLKQNNVMDDTNTDDTNTDDTNTNNVLQININKTKSLLYYNLDIVGSDSKLSIDNTNNSDMIYNTTLVQSIDESENSLWTFINPLTLNNTNPYNSNDFTKLENGKIYRILNEGVKDYNKTNTYLTINELDNELLIPYNDKLFNNNLTEDPTLWKCILNEDNTYSFLCMYNNQKLGNLTNRYSLFKNINNKLEFKNKDLSINDKYLSDKFYIQHSNNEYYNIMNSKNLNYYVCGFSNNNNSYDNYTMDNMKYTHKIANNSEWLLSCKLEEKHNDNKIFSDEVYYYLYGSKNNTINYSISHKYNDIYNQIYYENSNIYSKDNKIVQTIKDNKNNFMRYNGFTLKTNINCNPNTSAELKNYGNDNISIILTTDTYFYTIRFINYKKDKLLIRINSTEISKITKNNTLTKQIEEHNTLFDQLEYKKIRSRVEINLNICAPDIYTEVDLFNSNSVIHLTYDKEFLNIYVNNKLITFTRILNTLFNDIYFTSNINTQWKDTLWYKHDKLLNIPLWKTENIDNFQNNKPGIRFISKTNPNVKFEATIEQKTVGLFYIKNINNEYLSIKNKAGYIYDVEFIKELPSQEDKCLWKLYDTNVNKIDKIKVLDNKRIINNIFKINKNDLVNITNASDSYYDDIYNSTNVMLKARINKDTKQIDETSNYMYSIIDIDNTDNMNEKICTWLHNKNGHTAIDYDTTLIGSHFTTDLWNLQYIFGRDPETSNTYVVKYKNNKGTVKIDSFILDKYPKYYTKTTLKTRWENYEEIQEFNSIKSQDNIYVESIIDNNIQSNNICLSLNDERNAATCSKVEDNETCVDTPNSLLYIPNETCENVLYKNYKLLNGEKMNGGKLQGGNAWRPEKYFYLNNTNENGYIFNNTFNIKYEPSFEEKNKPVLDKWTYKDTTSKNIIFSKIFSKFEYDGYIIDEEKKLIRAIILPNNFVLFTNKSFKRNVYVKGRIKAFSVDYKNINIIETKKYFNNYNNYYINIKTNIGNNSVQDNKISVNDKLNKCYDLIKEGICIPTGNNKTSIGNNLFTYDFLVNKYDKFKNNKKHFRIANIYGKYLCDLYVNNTHLCDSVDTNSIVFQGQYNSVNLEKEKNKEKEHVIHATSYESLWKIENIEGTNTYKIINSYTNKELNDIANNGTSKVFYVKYVDNKYFKQQFINKDKSSIVYNNEDIFYIYYINEIDEKEYYLSYEDILINDVYNKRAKLKFVKKTDKDSIKPFIIQEANYNLNILTDENVELPYKIINKCYNKMKVCGTNDDISLIQNNKLRCLNILYKIWRINDTSKTYVYTPDSSGKESVYKPNLYNSLIKTRDEFLRLSPGKYEIEFTLNNIAIKQIIYSLTTLIGAVDIEIKVYKFKKNTYSELSTYKKNIPRSSERIEEEYSLLITKLDYNNDTQIKIKFIMSSLNSIKLNYIEIFGQPLQNEFTSETIIHNKTISNLEPVKITKSLISKKTNIENNLVKIKYISNIDEDNNDLNKNLIGIKNNLYHKPIINNISTANMNHTFLMVFNPLLNAYMFYMDDNKFLNLKIHTDNNTNNNTNNNTDNNTNNNNIDNNTDKYVNGYYFKLIESDSIPIKKYKLYYIKCYDDDNLYVNIINNKVLYSTIPQDFIFMNSTDTLDAQKLLRYNNLITNNILYSPYIKTVYITGVGDNVNKYLSINGNDITSIRMDYSNEKVKLLLKQLTKTQWSIMNADSNSQLYITIDNFVNLGDNIYMFSTGNSDISYEVVIKLYYSYNTELKIHTNAAYKKHISFNDVNKTIDNTNKYEKPLVRDVKYRSYESILNRIILNNIIALRYNNTYLVGNNENNLLYVNKLNENGYFVEIEIKNDNKIKLCKLWNHKFKKLVKYNIVNNSFSLDENITEYNDIDILNDIDITHIFEKIDNNNRITYKLYYVMQDTYLNPTNIDIKNEFSINTLMSTNNLNFDKYQDYCSKMCNSSSYLEDKLIINKNYNIISSNNLLFISLFEYEITFANTIPKYPNYYIINSTLNDSNTNILLKNFKEAETLEKIFTDVYNQQISNTDDSVDTTNTVQITDTVLINDTTRDTVEIEMLIVTVNINKEDLKYCNIILWKYQNMIIGRFENIYDKPINETSFLKKPLKVIYDSNYNKLDFNNNKSYTFTSYKNPPSNKKYIKLNKLNHEIINKFKISLYHYDNVKEEEKPPTDSPIKNKLSNIRKLYTTCSWGDCIDYDTLTTEDINKVSTNLYRFEKVNSGKLQGGMLDNNMIRFIKQLNNNNTDNSNNNIDFYKNAISNKTSYVDKNLTYYETKNILDLMFKENDILEVHKIFGLRGWTNSYDSLYNKTLFKINKKSNIRDIDYYDSFRHIYPVSYLQKKYAFNVENLWKSNNWFEDSPHFRSLPSWKFEEVQITENKNTNLLNTLDIQIGGKKGLGKRITRITRNNNNNKNNKNKTNENNNIITYPSGTRFSNIIIVIFIVLVIYYIYKTY